MSIAAKGIINLSSLSAVKANLNKDPVHLSEQIDYHYLRFFRPCRFNVLFRMIGQKPD